MATKNRPISRSVGASAEQALWPEQRKALDAYLVAKQDFMEKLGVKTDDELCTAIDKMFLDLFPKAH